MEDEDEPHEYRGCCYVEGVERNRGFLVYSTSCELESDDVKREVEELVKKIFESDDDPYLRNVDILIVGEYTVHPNAQPNFKVEVFSRSSPSNVVKAKEIYRHIMNNTNGQFDACEEKVELGNCSGDSCVKVGELKCNKRMMIYEVADQETSERLTREFILNAYSKGYSDAGPIMEMKKRVL